MLASWRFPHDITSAVTAEEGLALAELAEGRTVLELGSQWGCSTVCMAQVAKLVHAVDSHLGDTMAGQHDSLPLFWKNLHRYGVTAKVVAHLGLFADVLPLFRPQSFDMVFLDGCHDGAAVASDLAALGGRGPQSLLRPDAVWAFHDYGRCPGVTLELHKAFGYPSQVVETLAIYNK